MGAPIIVWHRHDLRLNDNPALHHALKRDVPVVPVYIVPEEDAGDWPMGGAHAWWLHHALEAFGASLAERQSRLVLRKGSCAKEIQDLVRDTGAGAVYWNTMIEPHERERDRGIEKDLHASGVEVVPYDGQILHDPNEVSTNKGDPYKVYTPFRKNLDEHLNVPLPLEAPAFKESHRPSSWPAGLPLDALGLLPEFDWAGGLRESWTPGEAHALERLDAFIDDALAGYGERRDYPGVDGTSRMSPHLHFGEISPATIWHRVKDYVSKQDRGIDPTPYLNELVWRDFSYHILYHFPGTTNANLKDAFDDFPWTEDQDALERWQRGETGYPIVDAGMRQLWHTGWMHNRVRMVVASFLTKHLLIHWRQGARWFWDTLVDGNLASNTMGWQWAAGSGADAQPFFRIFNPITQGEKYDPEGAYIHRWIPELEGVSGKALYAPWTLPAAEQAKAGARIGATYPAPIVVHKEARERALDAYDRMRKAGA